MDSAHIQGSWCPALAPGNSQTRSLISRLFLVDSGGLMSFQRLQGSFQSFCKWMTFKFTYKTKQKQKNHNTISWLFSSRSTSSEAQGQKGWECQLSTLFFMSVGNQQTSHQITQPEWDCCGHNSQVPVTPHGIPTAGLNPKGKASGQECLKYLKFCLSVTTLHLVYVATVLWNCVVCSVYNHTQ